MAVGGGGCMLLNSMLSKREQGMDEFLKKKTFSCLQQPVVRGGFVYSLIYLFLTAGDGVTDV